VGSSALDRIHRLERLELDRLQQAEERDERRRQQVAGAKPSGGRHDLVDRVEAITRVPVAILGAAWVVVFVMVLTRRADGSASEFLVGTLFVIWAILLVEYVVRLLITPDTRSYVKRRWAEPATVVLPPLQGWHLIGVERVCLVIHEGLLRLEAILKHHSLFRVLIAAVITLFLGAWLVLLFEENVHGSSIHSYPDALWWAIVTVTTIGYGDFTPITAGGRAVAVVLMLVGIGLIGVITATVASLFIKEHTDSNKEEFRRGHADLGQQLAVISGRLADVERRLGASADEVEATDEAAEDEEASTPADEGAPAG
jgi:voltage-gated potassium channel